MSLIGKPSHQDYPDELYKEWVRFSGPNCINKRNFILNTQEGSISMTHTAYIRNTELAENGNFRLFAANGKQ
jgi:hypothetical protein